VKNSSEFTKKDPSDRTDIEVIVPNKLII